MTNSDLAKLIDCVIRLENSCDRGTTRFGNLHRKGVRVTSDGYEEFCFRIQKAMTALSTHLYDMANDTSNESLSLQVDRVCRHLKHGFDRDGSIYCWRGATAIAGKITGIRMTLQDIQDGVL